jgi:RHS repeat-associated protein
VYLGDTPVAVLTQSIAGTAPSQVTTTNLHYVYADHLGTARVITRATDNKMVWRWDNADPFGMLPPDGNPSQLGAFTYNPRFPGQVYDRESGLFYNYFRDYDPATGRYVESDPIGLEGGINTYGYAIQNPLSHTDEFGLNAGVGAIVIGIGITGMKACMKIAACKKAVEQAIKNCKNVECKFERHKRHHYFPGQGNMFCEHYEIICTIKGSKGTPPVFKVSWPFTGKCTPNKGNDWLP